MLIGLLVHLLCCLFLLLPDVLAGVIALLLAFCACLFASFLIAVLLIGWFLRLLALFVLLLTCVLALCLLLCTWKWHGHWGVIGIQHASP